MKARFLTFAISILILLAASAAAEVRVYHFQTETPEIQDRTEGLKVLMPGAPSLGQPGEPLLPKAPFRLLLAPGEKVTRVEVLPLETRPLSGSRPPLVAQAPQILSQPGSYEKVAGLRSIYQSQENWPADPLVSWREDLFRGHRVLTLVLSPVRYRGSDDQLSWHPSFEIHVHSEFDDHAREASASMLRVDEGTRSRLASLVDNPEMLHAYDGIASGIGNSRSFGELDYLILTTQTWAEQLEPFVEFLRSRGHQVETYLRSWVNENYDGRDEPETLRNFIKDAYQGTGAEYLLLVGDTRDDNGIPHRGLFCQAYSTTDYDIPGDIYYGALDGDWNPDGDGRWGEPGEADLFPEMAVGRACVSDAEDLDNFIRKQMLYQDDPVAKHADRMLMIGEKLWTNPLTWGATYKDEIWYGSDANGIVTAGVPSTMAVGGLYERDWTWQKEHLMVILNDGLGIVNHQGHAYYNLAAKLHNNDLPLLHNDGIENAYGFFYSQGCYCGSFDDKASYGGYPADCFGERLTTEFGGAVAAVMNSRYGWGDAGGTAGPSQYFDREFFDALFGEGVHEAGLANDDSKMDLAWMVDYPGMRWCHYDLNLFGDPAMKIWTGQPRPMSLMNLLGLSVNSQEIKLRVLSDGAPVREARVTLYSKELGVQVSATTNITGQAILEVPPLQEGVYTLTVHRQDFLSIRSTRVVRAEDEPGEEPADQDGNPEEGGAPLQSAPPRLALGPNHPNPFNPSTTLHFELPEDGEVYLAVYDVEGRRVRTLLSERHLVAGLHTTVWDGRDEDGRELGSGVYFTLLVSGNVSDAGKMLMLK